MRKFLLVLLAIHSAVTIWSLRDAGFWAPFPPFSEDYVYQIFFDLVVALTVLSFLCAKRLKKKGRSFNGLYVMMAGTALLGSFSMLAYLLIERDLFDD
jgi:hypothetical protein